jgi:hypothetical protein
VVWRISVDRYAQKALYQGVSRLLKTPARLGFYLRSVALRW